MSLEKEFEKAGIFWLKKCFQVEEATKKEDLFEGTDLYLEGYRCDLTFNEEKDNTEYFSEYKRLSTGLNDQYFHLKMGIRTGNVHHQFDESVFVIKIEAADERLFRRDNEVFGKALYNHKNLILEGLNMFDELMNELV